jgi:hypothetical protein
MVAGRGEEMWSRSIGCKYKCCHCERVADGLEYDAITERGGGLTDTHTLAPLVTKQYFSSELHHPCVPHYSHVFRLVDSEFVRMGLCQHRFKNSVALLSQIPCYGFSYLHLPLMIS